MKISPESMFSKGNGSPSLLSHDKMLPSYRPPSPGYTFRGSAPFYRLFLLAACLVSGLTCLVLLFTWDWQDYDNANTAVNHVDNVNTENIVKQRLPQAIIIGARKSGTRALLEALSLHPKIRTARYEVHYFDQNDTYAKGLDWYRAQMPTSRADQVTIEKTPGYLTSSAAPERLRAMNESIKLIVILRDPVTRAISDYSQVHQNKLDRGKPHDSFEHLVFQPDGSISIDYKPLRNSLYVKHLRRWMSVFPDPDQYILLDGDRFITDPLSQVRKVEQFLGLEPWIRQSQMYFNATKGFYCFQPNIRTKPKCLGDTKGRVHVMVDAQVQQRLRQLLQPYNERFYELVGRRFDW